MIAGQKRFWDQSSLPFPRPGIMGVLEQSALETLLVGRFQFAHHAGKETDAALKEHLRRNLAAREDEIADRDLFHVAAFNDALIEPFKSAAKQNDAWALGDFPDPALRQRIEDTAAGRRPCAPATLADERATNPFLRWHDPAIRKNLGMEKASDEEVFAEIRKRKDVF